MVRFWPTILLGLALLAAPAGAQPPAGVERLRGALLAGGSATQTLTRYCESLKLASPPVIRALRDPVTPPAPPDLRALLKADATAAIRYRRVRLVCGDHVLSEADNWYLPSRLTPEMNRTLDETETPFGTVVRPLDFHRRTLEAVPIDSPRVILRIRALLLTAADVPFSLVTENYSRDLVGR